jgi:4-carboxymuconolactone decarboxylase
MNIGRSQQGAFLAIAIAAIAIAPHSISTAFASGASPSVPQANAATLPSDSETVLARLRLACPLLGSIVEKFAMQDLGELVLGDGMKSGSHELAVIAELAASGDAAAMKEHARAALDDGATKLELKEVLYLTAVSAGIPRAIEATRVLSELLGVPADQCSDQARRAAGPQS